MSDKYLMCQCFVCSVCKCDDIDNCIDLSPQASLSMAPVNIFKHGADEEKAETARLVRSFISVIDLYIYFNLTTWGRQKAETLFSLQSSFIGAIAIGDLVKSTLGPKGMVGHTDFTDDYYFNPVDLIKMNPNFIVWFTVSERKLTKKAGESYKQEIKLPWRLFYNVYGI